VYSIAGRRNSVQVFVPTTLDSSATERTRQIREYVKKMPEGDLGAGDPDQISELVAAKFRFPEMPEFAPDQVERDDPVFTQGSDRVTIRVYFPYKGDLSLFRLYYSSRPMSPPPPSFEVGNGILTKTYTLEKQRIDDLDRQVENEINTVKQYASQVATMIPRFNQMLLERAKEEVQARLNEMSQNKQAAARVSQQSKLAVRKRQDGTDQVVVPVQRKQIVLNKPPEPKTPLSEYVLGMAEYDDIIKTISSMVKVMERTPSVFAPMDEEPLRTILLVALNGLYEGQATGETFNGNGKTDILIRRENRNVFIAECLMWKGPKYLQEKMDGQLFQYAMWRDSKLALIIFNRGVSFTHTIQTMKDTVRGHQQCVNQMAWEHESGARFVFRRHDDPSRHFLVTALAFDVPSGA
jgi:hypothetical protein